MEMRRGAADRSELVEILGAILESRGASIAHRGTVWEATVPEELARILGAERIRLVAAPSGRAARGAEMDAAMTERILLLGRSQGEVTRLVARVPLPRGASPEERQWVRLHWRIRYGSDDLAEELLVQRIPVGPADGVRLPQDVSFRAATADEAGRLASPDPELLATAWLRGLRQLESRIRRRLRPHEDRMRRELHREMRTLSVHFRSLIAEERTGRRRSAESRDASRMLQLKEDWERKLAAAVRQRALDTEARLVAVALLSVLPVVRVARGRGAKTV